LAEWRDRVATRRGVVVAGTAAGLVAAAVAVFILLRPPSGSAPRLTLPRADEAPQPSSALGGAPDTESGKAGPPVSGAITVHAAGAVARPGVYAVPSGARVADVVSAAGGPVPEADLDRLNLAARVSDGDRVSVPRKGDPPTPQPGAAGTPAADAAAEGAGGDASGRSSPSPAGPVDLNAATLEQLDTLPGVGPATARAIVAYRTRHGRFRSVTELLEVPGIGPTKLEALRPLVRV
jgi:competence protein ComEA